MTRKQFPITPAAAISIHKSHESTYEIVCVHYNAIRFKTTSLLYVALSRKNSLKNLYLIGKLNKADSEPNIQLLDELQWLRTEAKLKLDLFENYQENMFIIFY